MNAKESPFICSCSFCGDGLLRFVRCSTCDEIVALCDECELMWSDIAGVFDDANLPSASSYPVCPYCGDKDAEFARLGLDAVQDSHLQQFIEGESV